MGFFARSSGLYSLSIATTVEVMYSSAMGFTCILASWVIPQMLRASSVAKYQIIF